MRRSLLFIPANHPAMLQNADVFAADAVIFDLEDAVMHQDKDAARDLLNQYLNTFSAHKMEYIIRINGMDTSYFKDDLKHIVSDQIDTILLPKATKKTVEALGKALSKIEESKSMRKNINIIALIETPIAFFEIEKIAKHQRVNGLLLGAEDLAYHLGVERTLVGQEIFFARSMVVFAAKAHHIDAIDTPSIDTQNEDKLKEDATRAKSLGMTAKACIHPNQIDLVNQIFSPSAIEIEQAIKIITASQLKENQQKGAFLLDGKMVDKPIIEKAHALLDKAKAWHIL